MTGAPTYSIAVCCYEMVETVEPSLRSVLAGTGPDYEVVVVDGGSRDGTVAALERLSEEYDRLRPVFRDPDPDRHLGADRTRAVRACRGDYVFTQLDVDDRYFDGVVRDFARIYRTIEPAVDGPFFLSGRALNLAPRDLLAEDYPYRNMPRCEDRDLWRRLFAGGAIRWLDHGPVAESLGYDRGPVATLRNDFRERVWDFRAGVTLESALRWSLDPDRPFVLERERSGPARAAKAVYDLLAFPLARVAARGGPAWRAPPGFERKGALETAIARSRATLSEMEAAYGVAVDDAELSEAGRRAFRAYGTAGADAADE